MHEEMSIALQVAILAVQIGVILFAARLAGNLAAKLRMPSVLGELLAGIIIGPYVLGKLGIPLHGFEHGIFPLPAGSSIPVSLPLYSLVHNAVEAPINIVIYVLGFSLVAYIMLLIAMGVDRLAKGKKEKAVA